MLLISSQAYGAVIFDTGTPPDAAVYGYMENGLGYAARFTLSDPYSLTNIEAHFTDQRWRHLQVSGTATLAIYGDGIYSGIIPDVNSQLYDQNFLVGAATGWYGVSGVNWALPAGNYWVAFEVRTGDTYTGAMDRNPINPIPDEALITNYGTYSDNDNLDFAYRAYGNPSGVVPEPATMVLFGIGAAAMAMARRKKRIS